MDLQRAYNEERQIAAGQKWKLPPSGQPVSLFGVPPNANDDGLNDQLIERRCVMQPSDDSKAFYIHKTKNTVAVAIYV